MLSFALVLIGMVVVLAFLVNWWEPEDRPAPLEDARLRAARALRGMVHARPARRAVKRSRAPGSGRGR